MNAEAWTSLVLVALVAIKPDWVVPLFLGLGALVMVFAVIALCVPPSIPPGRSAFKRCHCCGKPVYGANDDHHPTWLH